MLLHEPRKPVQRKPVFVVAEVIATRVGLRRAVERELRVEAEYQCDAQPVLAGLTLGAVLTLREISESDLRLILPARAELEAVWVAAVVSMFCRIGLCLLWSPLSIAAETKPRQRSTERKADYRDSRFSQCNNVTIPRIT
jgi:hypothetical protein